MKEFWYQGGFLIQPESEYETELLARMAGCVNWESPLGTQVRITSGSCESGSDDLLEHVVAHCQGRPGRLPTKSGNQKREASHCHQRTAVGRL